MAFLDIQDAEDPAGYARKYFRECLVAISQRKPQLV